MYGFSSLEYISRVIFPLGGWGGTPRIKNVHCALNNLAVLDRDRYIQYVKREKTLTTIYSNCGIFNQFTAQVFRSRSFKDNFKLYE